MFTHHCTACDKVQLIFLSQVSEIHDADRGTVASFTCWCGSAQESLLGGAPGRRTPVAA